MAIITEARRKLL